MIFRSLALGTALLHWLSVAATSQEEGVLLRYSYRKGDRDRTRDVQEVLVTPALPGQNFFSHSRQIMTAAAEVTEVDPQGNARIRHVIHDLRVSLTEPDGSRVTYDSARVEDRKRAEGHPRLKGYHAMVGGAMLHTASPLGQCSSFDLSGFAQGLEELPLAAALREAIRRSVEQSGLPLPETPVHKGDQWKRDLKLPTPAGGEAIIPVTYTVLGLESRDGVRFVSIGVTLAQGEGELLFHVDGGYVAWTRSRHKSVVGEKQVEFISEMVRARGEKEKLPDGAYEAMALFEALEKKFLTAASLQGQVQSHMTDKASGRAVHQEGPVALAAGGRLRMHLRTPEDKKGAGLREADVEVISDGEKVQAFGFGEPTGPPQAVPSSFQEIVGKTLARSSAAFAAPLLPGLTARFGRKPEILDQYLTTYDFRWGGPARIDGKDSVSIDYKLRSSAFPLVQFRLHLDPASDLPLRRHCLMKNDATEATIDERYDRWKVGEDVPKDFFNFPK